MDFREVIEFLKDASKYIVMIVIVFLFFVFVFGLQQVVGPSMYPTLKEGDVIIVNKLLYRFKEIKRNDVVVLMVEEKYMIKRVVGLPGEYVEYKNDHVIVDGVEYSEPFIVDNHTEDFSIKDLGYDVIPEDMYLVLGDNRQNSKDSRSYGLISKKEIVGKSYLRIWPIKDIKFVK